MPGGPKEFWGDQKNLRRIWGDQKGAWAWASSILTCFYYVWAAMHSKSAINVLERSLKTRIISSSNIYFYSFMLLKILSSSHCTLIECTNARPRSLIIRPRTMAIYWYGLCPSHRQIAAVFPMKAVFPRNCFARKSISLETYSGQPGHIYLEKTEFWGSLTHF